MSDNFLMGPAADPPEGGPHDGGPAADVLEGDPLRAA
jgi:hypothetical protein